MLSRADFLLYYGAKKGVEQLLSSLLVTENMDLS